MELLKEKLLQFFRWQMDGQKYYIGRSMTEVHRDLGITDEVFDKACQVFTASVKKVKPKLKIMREFVKRIGGLRNEIVHPKNPDVSLDQINLSKMSLFKALGEETGFRNIIEIVFE